MAREVGIVIRGFGGFYDVYTEAGHVYTLRAQGKLRLQKITPMVGDSVLFTPGDNDENGWLEVINERRNMLKRPPVANIDINVIVLSASTPLPDLMLTDRLIIQSHMENIGAMIVINKIDGGEDAAREIASQYEKSQARVFLVSAEKGIGTDDLREALQGKTFSLAGQSGVGKSTIINAMFRITRPTGELSVKTERGKHTTRHVELLPMGDGTMALDTPGFSILDLPLMDPYTLCEWVPEFGEYDARCRFQPCSHVAEPGCAVLEAVRNREISGARWERYAVLYEDMKKKWRERYG